MALYLAFEKLLKEGKIAKNPVTHFVAAVSCAVSNGEEVLDVDYVEDSSAQADMNFVLIEDHRIVEIQGTAEGEPFSEEQFNKLFSLAKKGIAELINVQKNVLGVSK